jgi:hypothetical protein
VFLLIFPAIALPWWIGTRGADFLSPPTDEALALIRETALAALPRLATHSDAISPHGHGSRVIVDTSPPPLGDLSAKPSLDEYSARAGRNSAELIDIAARLDKEGHIERALLAWERILDFSEADEAMVGTAIEAIRQLRPRVKPWIDSPDRAFTVFLEAGTGIRAAEALEPVLSQVGADLAQASSGILNVTTRVHAGPDDLVAEGPVPVAIWLSGGGEDPAETGVLTFTVATPETIEHDVHRIILQLVVRQLSSSNAIPKPPDVSDETDPRDVLRWGITRLQWREFGRMLNPVVEIPAD